MPDLLEQDLIRVLMRAEAAADAPVPPANLPTTVERRFRRRRTRRAAVVTASVCVLTALAVGLPSMLTDRARPNAAPAAPSAQPQPSVTASPPGPNLGPLKFPTTTAGLAPVQKVWPRAVYDVPRAAPGGGTYTVVAQLDATHVLVTHEWSLQNPTTLYSWDVTSRKATRLADIRGPSGVRSYFPQEFTSNASEIFWWAMDNVNTGGPSNTYVWALPKSGGQPRLVGMVELPDALSRTGARDLSDMRATETALYWSGFAGGVYTMPVRGGKATPLTGYENYRMVAFPWATELNPANFVQENGRIFGETPGIASRLRNVLTGQEIQVVAPPHARSLWCVPTFCVGESRDAASFAMRPDGSHVTPLPGFGYSLDDGVLDGRFAVGHPVGADVVVLVDTQTWQAGLLSVDGVGTLSGLQFWVKGGSTGVFLSAAVR